MKTIKITLVFMLWFCGFFTNAQNNENQSNIIDPCLEPKAQEVQRAAIEEAGQVPTIPQGLKDLNFGVGIGASGLLGAGEVNEAIVENGIVRITDEQSIRREFWFETHYVIHQGCIQGIKRPYGIGPFVAISVIDDKGLFNSLGAGVLVSLKRTEAKDQEDKSAFNIGLGVKLTGYNVLGDGIEANKPLPDGAENIRYKRVAGVGWMVLFSFSF